MSDGAAVGCEGTFEAPESHVGAFSGLAGHSQSSKINNSDLARIRIGPRPQRRMVALDGPLQGRTIPFNVIADWPAVWCAKPPGGQWEHYRHIAAGQYAHAGTCVERGHEPLDLCEAVRPAGGGLHQRHACIEVGPHPVHRCCCGDEWGDDA